MRIIQFNINHCEAAYDLLMQTACELKLDLVLIPELYKHQTMGDKEGEQKKMLEEAHR